MVKKLVLLRLMSLLILFILLFLFPSNTMKFGNIGIAIKSIYILVELYTISHVNLIFFFFGWMKNIAYMIGERNDNIYLWFR